MGFCWNACVVFRWILTDETWVCVFHTGKSFFFVPDRLASAGMSVLLCFFVFLSARPRFISGVLHFKTLRTKWSLVLTPRRLRGLLLGGGGSILWAGGEGLYRECYVACMTWHVSEAGGGLDLWPRAPKLGRWKRGWGGWGVGGFASEQGLLFRPLQECHFHKKMPAERKEAEEIKTSIYHLLSSSFTFISERFWARFTLRSDINPPLDLERRVSFQGELLD